MRKLVIAKTPRNKPFLVFGVLVPLALFGGFGVYGSISDLMSFGMQTSIRISSLSVKILGCIFFPILLISVLIAAIRNNPKSQPVETILVIAGLVNMLILAVLSTPILFLWAYLHGYHLDHYEPAHRGGWYIFKLNGT